MFKLGWVAVGIGFFLVGCSGGLSDEMLAGLPPKEAGKKVFDARCKRCHIIGGSGGTRGPNLSGVGGRMDEATLRQFVKDPSSVKPGSRMPNPSLSEKQIEVVAAYLAELK
ncbi:MAG: c-type cytochrome [Candidatus Manganitrophaceae bacterium]